jgi:hypothetical protein
LRKTAGEIHRGMLGAVIPSQPMAWLTGLLVTAYTAPPVDYQTGPIVILIVAMLCAAVVLAFFFASPVATRLTDRHHIEQPPPPEPTGYDDSLSAGR